ncbi:phospho-sugar mutase, partial [Flavonifractor plautii]|uniref:phospho-sugar mutase n=2 Tax=Clostridia TaxID=186801 RepID=UPI0018A95704
MEEHLSYIKTAKERYEKWCSWDGFDRETKEEVRSLVSWDEIYDRFRSDLTFGTGGLRGTMGAGTNRINVYTVRKATMGLANYLLKHADAYSEASVVIAYDSRNNSRFFAENTAQILSKKGIKSYLFEKITPTPVLSYAVRRLKCRAGIVITASHNPKEYNGYKVYDETGCQITQKAADEIYAEIQHVNLYKDIVLSPKDTITELITYLDDEVLEGFLEEVKKQSVFVNSEAKADLKISYTPLHGTGFLPVTKILNRDGFKNVHVVELQATEDGNFPTVKSPNPEERGALEMAIQQAAVRNDDIVLGTDPDCDRVGVAVWHRGKYQLISGNQIGALLIDFLLQVHKPTERNHAIVKTIVTNDLGAEIAKKNGLVVINTLTGFKYIGEQINHFLETGAYSFFMGYEESFGYLIGTHARDKDAVVSSMLICEMAAYAKNIGITLIDWIERIYFDYGYYLDDLETFTLKGEVGEEKILEIMNGLRQNPYKCFPRASCVIDYKNGIDGLPSSNVIKLYFPDRSWVAVRPSGTEPKVKFYYSAYGQNKNQAESRLAELKDRVQEVLRLS